VPIKKKPKFHSKIYAGHPKSVHGLSQLSDEGSSVKKLHFYHIILGVFIFFTIVLVIGIFLQFSQISNLENELALLKETHLDFVSKSELKISELNSEISDLLLENAKMESMYVDLSKEYSILKSKNDIISSSYATLKSEAQSTIEKIDLYKNEIQSSMAWFNNNSFLTKNQNVVLSYLESDCFNDTGVDCQVNLGCFYFVNDKFLGLRYALDTETSSVIDKLQSLESFYANRKGDCEDFALFYKAEYNSLIKKCGGKSVVLSSWVDKLGEKFYVNSASTWFLSSATSKVLLSENIYPVVVCGAMFDLQSNQINGHCVVAFVNKNIVSSVDLSVIKSAELVEPQTGKYLGFVGAESGIYLIDSSSSNSSYIDTVITDSDFFIFRDGKWDSYSDFFFQLSESRSSLQNLISN